MKAGETLLAWMAARFLVGVLRRNSWYKSNGHFRYDNKQVIEKRKSLRESLSDEHPLCVQYTILSRWKSACDGDKYLLRKDDGHIIHVNKWDVEALYKLSTTRNIRPNFLEKNVPMSLVLRAECCLA